MRAHTAESCRLLCRRAPAAARSHCENLRHIAAGDERHRVERVHAIHRRLVGEWIAMLLATRVCSATACCGRCRVGHLQSKRVHTGNGAAVRSGFCARVGTVVGCRGICRCCCVHEPPRARSQRTMRDSVCVQNESYLQNSTPRHVPEIRAVCSRGVCAAITITVAG